MELTQVWVGGVWWVLAEPNKLSLSHPHVGLQTPHFQLAFAYGQALIHTLLLPLMPWAEQSLQPRHTQEA
jgi:hypothetical protein